MSKVGGQRNFGYGKTLAWAAKNALQDRFGSGRFATQATHRERWSSFVTFSKAAGIKDAGNITREHIEAYAQNLLSSVNVILGALRGDQVLRVSPAQSVGERSNVRSVAPVSLDREKVTAAVQSLLAKDEARVAAIILLARELGLRFREASMMDAKQTLRQAQDKGRVNVTEGTKRRTGARDGSMGADHAASASRT